MAVIPPEDLPTTYEYHNGFVRVVNRGPAKWIYWRNEQGDITEQVDPQGNSTFYRYNPQGRLLEIRHADGSLHQLGWNNLGQLLEERLPNGGQRKYRYDELGRQTPATTPSELGIGPFGNNRAAGNVELKLQGIYRTTAKTPVLKSTAKSIDDTWLVKGMTQTSSGGGT